MANWLNVTITEGDLNFQHSLKTLPFLLTGVVKREFPLSIEPPIGTWKINVKGDVRQLDLQLSFLFLFFLCVHVVCQPRTDVYSRQVWYVCVLFQYQYIGADLCIFFLNLQFFPNFQ